MRRTQVSQFAWRTDIEHSDLLQSGHPAGQAKAAYRLMFEDEHLLRITVRRLDAPFIREDFYFAGMRLATLLKDVIPEDLIAQTFPYLETVNGSVKNRPGIIGEGARQQGVRVDGKLSDRVRVPDIVVDEYGGKADMLGYYRYRNGDCELTAWTHQKPDIYKAVRPFIHKVDEIYRNFLPEEHAKQMKYVKEIPETWRIPGTAFTTLYVLKNAPTATHVDDFDYKDGYGCMASLGSFRGGWLCFPRYRIAIDYQPGDLLLADVHQVHANFPIYPDDLRIACVFFCRKNQHNCPA